MAGLSLTEPVSHPKSAGAGPALQQALRRRSVWSGSDLASRNASWPPPCGRALREARILPSSPSADMNPKVLGTDHLSYHLTWPSDVASPLTLQVMKKRSAVEELRQSVERHLESGIQIKKQRCLDTDKPSLLHLCMRQAALHLSRHAQKIPFLPTNLSISLLHDFLRRSPAPSYTELKILCESSWCSPNLSLRGVPRLNSKGVQEISVLSNLVQLDFRGCQWLGNLHFLSALNSLECLNLRDCWFLKADDLLHIRELPKLQCLDVENVSAMSDDLAAHTISELKNLRALNVSGTCVGDGMVELLTYGSRLHSWASQQGGAGIEDVKLVTETGQYGMRSLMSQYPVSNLTYLRLQRTHITHVAIAHLLAIPDLQLLDVRLTNVTGRSLFSLKAKHKLIALPNNARVAARTNAMLAGVLEGECGCRAMTRHCKSSNSEKVPDELTELWQQAFVQFLQEASNRTSC